MSVSNTERREVVQRLQELRLEDHTNAYVSWSQIARAINPDGGTFDELLSLLISLIEQHSITVDLKVSEDKMRELVHEVAVDYVGVNREALIDIANDMERTALTYDHYDWKISPIALVKYVNSIRKALGDNQ